MMITLRALPTIPFKRGGGTCGVEGFGVGMQANVVNWIRYEIRDLKKAPVGYASLFTKSAGAPGEDTRFELVRVELDADGNEMENTLELVAEYAVDLKFALTVVSSF